MAPKLVLTGFMATGKTSVSRLLAARLGWRLIDTDNEITMRAGKPIPKIFSDDGETHFRAIERAVIAAIVADRRLCPQCGSSRPAVIATGGGALVDESNRAALRRIGMIICLSARPEIIAERVRQSRTARPKLLEGNQSLEQRIAILMDARRDAYAQADIIVDTSDLHIDEVADRVLAAFAVFGERRNAEFYS